MKLSKSLFSIKKMIFILLFGCFLFTNSCKDDDCPLTCQNGGTLNVDDCECICPEGFTGETCETEIPPTAVRITGIRVLNYPETNSGIAWDPNGLGSERRPDLQIDVYLWGESEPIASTRIRQDVLNNSTTSLSIDTEDNFIYLSDPTAQYRIILYDFDGPLDHNRQQMASGELIPYQGGARFPEMTIVNGPGFAAEIDLEYLR